MLDALLEEQCLEVSVAVAGTAVGQNALDREAESGVESSCHEEKEHGRLVVLVGQDGGEADAAVIVDGDVQIFVAGASSLASVIAMDAMARLYDPGQPFDIEVDEIARPLVLIAHHRRRRIERAQPVHTRPAQDPAYRGAAETKRLGDAPAVVAQPPKSQNLFQ